MKARAAGIMTVAVAAAAWLLGCSNRMASGGDATETGNARDRTDPETFFA